MWGFIIAFFGICALLSVFFLWTRFCKFGIVKKLSGGKKWKRILFAFIPLAVFGIFILIKAIDTLIVMIHMSLYFLLAELVAFIIRKIRKKEKETDDGRFQPYIVGIIVIVIEICYFSAGWFLAHHVFETDYSVATAKELGVPNIRVALIADSHIGAVFDGEGFGEHLEKIQAAKPDILVISGDFVDDGTTKEDLQKSCEALSKFKCTYGIYYVYGNHDKGYYSHKNFSVEEFRSMLKGAGVTMLEDEAVLLEDSFYIIGRKDKSDRSRKPIGDIMATLDPSKYSIVLDHQPNDYEAEAAAGADLVLSGHTHGGQLIPMKLFAYLINANDSTYGMETRDKTTFIVTSGIGDWEIGFKTGCKAEFCVIDIAKQTLN